MRDLERLCSVTSTLVVQRQPGVADPGLPAHAAPAARQRWANRHRPGATINDSAAEGTQRFDEAGHAPGLKVGAQRAMNVVQLAQSTDAALVQGGVNLALEIRSICGVGVPVLQFGAHEA